MKKKPPTTTQLITYCKKGSAGQVQEWFAQIAGKPGTKVSGKTQVEAVGRLVMAKHRHLRLQVRRDETRDL